jgi:large subunit ribosomal protein L30
MLAVVRIKGSINVEKKAEDAMQILRLDAPNRCVVVPDDPSHCGMITRVKDYITFGKIDLETFLELLKKRGRLEGDKRLDESTVKLTGFDSLDELAKSIFEGKVHMNKVPKLKPLFKLTPPAHGFKSTKLQYPKGDLGDRKDAMNELIKRMI